VPKGRRPAGAKGICRAHPAHRQAIREAEWRRRYCAEACEANVGRTRAKRLSRREGVGATWSPATHPERRRHSGSCKHSHVVFFCFRVERQPRYGMRNDKLSDSRVFNWPEILSFDQALRKETGFSLNSSNGSMTSAGTVSRSRRWPWPGKFEHIAVPESTTRFSTARIRQGHWCRPKHCRDMLILASREKTKGDWATLEKLVGAETRLEQAALKPGPPRGW
jgi:hypothetical protein